MLDFSGGTVAIFVAAAVLGPAPAATMAGVAVAAHGVSRRRPLLDTLSNVGNYGCFALLSGFAWVVWMQGPLDAGSAAVGGAIYVAADLISFLLAFAWRYVRRPEPNFLRLYGRQYVVCFPATFAGALVAVFGVWTYFDSGGVAIAFLGLALLLIQHLSVRLNNVESQLRVERDRAQTYLDSAGSVFVVLDGDSRIVQVNRRAQAMLGQPSADLVGRRWCELVPAADQSRFAQTVAHTGEIPLRIEAAVCVGDGPERVFQWSIARLTTAVGGRQLLLSGEDITDRRLTEQRLEHLAFNDPLTGLPNRIAFADALSRAHDAGGGFAVLFIDLDGFKAVNDQFGHPVGDELLCHAARRLVTAVRAEDCVARRSGDEFLVLLAELSPDPEQALEVVSEIVGRLCDEMEAPFALTRGLVSVGASIGLALHPRDGDDPERLISHADADMYLTKATRARSALDAPAA